MDKNKGDDGFRSTPQILSALSRVMKAFLPQEPSTSNPATTEQLLADWTSQASEKDIIQQDKEIHIGDKKLFVIEGDLLVSEEQYQEYNQLRKLLQEKKIDPSIATATALLGMVTDDQKLIRWGPTTARHLTYWIDAGSFVSKPTAEEVKRYMKSATEDWEFVCGLKFAEIDASEDALFKVAFNRDNSVPGLMATAFFPNSPPNERILWVFPDFSRTGFHAVGILRHELGHILGFRHEHIRLAQFSASEPAHNIFEITPYDPQSVMHYYLPPYAGSQRGELSRLDVVGAIFYYGQPLQHFTDF